MIIDEVTKHTGLVPIVRPHHQSSISDCLHCKRCWMFKNRWGIKPKRRKLKTSAKLGSLAHRLLELGPEGEGQVRKEVSDRLTQIQNDIEATGDLFGNLEYEATHLQELLDKAVVMVHILWNKYPVSDSYTVLEKEKKVTVKVALPTGREVLLAGTIDEVLQNNETREIWNKDHKTTGRNIDFTLTGYQFGLQCRLYRILSAYYLNTKITGFILNILQTPTIKFGLYDRDFTEAEHTFKTGKRAGETELRKTYEGEPKFENYLKRCKEWYENQGIASARSFSIRYTEPLFPDELVAAIEDAENCNALKATPELFDRDVSGTTCKAWERVCDYYPLCKTNPAAWSDIINNEYEIVRETEDECA